MPEPELTPYLDERSVVTGLASKLLDRIIANAESTIRSQWAKRKKHQAEEVASFLAGQVRTYRLIKNILYHNNPIELEKLYIPLKFSSDPYAYHNPSAKTLSDTAVLELAQTPNRLVIAPTAGAGKSFFMRKMLLALSANGAATEIAPIFFELRNLNGKPKLPLTTIILNHIKQHVPSFMPEQLDIGLEAGAFAIILDGYDEIEPENNSFYEEQILQFGRRFPKAPLVI